MKTDSRAYELLYKTLLAVWGLLPYVDKSAALSEILTCADEINNFLHQVNYIEEV